MQKGIILTFIFCGTFKSEVLSIANNTLKYEDLKPRIVSLFMRKVNQVCESESALDIVENKIFKPPQIKPKRKSVLPIFVLPISQ